MPNVVPPGFDPYLWNLAAVMTTIQALQAQVQPITAQQATDLQTQLLAAHASIVSGVVSQGQAPTQQPVTPP